MSSSPDDRQRRLDTLLHSFVWTTDQDFSNGDFGSAPFTAVDATTGEVAWRDRSVTRASLVAAGNELVILDEDGDLALATPGPSGLDVHAKVALLGERSWTPPTLSGTTLYVRDRHQIMALALGR